MTRRGPSDPFLPLDFRQRRRGGKRALYVSREEPAFYRAVLYLRRAGRRVYRQGGEHQVDGAIANTGQMLRLAEHLGWRP